MTLCAGQKLKKPGRCTSMLYKCAKCGAVGCVQLQAGDCTHQAFAVGKCLRCGSVQRAAL